MSSVDKHTKDRFQVVGVRGLPEYYPTPKMEDMLFYIQRNQNTDTVVYRARKHKSGTINCQDPIEVFWKKYSCNGPDSPINLIQKKLAYGVEHKVINNNTIEVSIVSYPEYKIFVTQSDTGEMKAISKINGEWSQLCNVYVFAVESGAFPIVKYIEIYGLSVKTGYPCYEKIDI